MKDIKAPRFKRNDVYNYELSNEIEEPVKKIRTFIAAIAANLSAIAVGISMGWRYSALPKLRAEDGLSDRPLPYPIDLRDIGYIFPIMAAGAIITSFIATQLADIIGRKKALLSSSIFFIIAYIVLFFLQKFKIIWILMLVCLIKGFGIGLVMSVVPMYVGEIATDNIRGALGSLMSLFMLLGIFAVQCIGPFVSYYGLQYFCIAAPIVFLIAFSFMPESPYFCIAKGNKNEALEALKFLRGQSIETVKIELRTIETMVENSMAQNGSIIDLIKNTVNRKALLICLGLITFQQVSGSCAVLIISQATFADMGFHGPIAAIIVTAIQVISAGLTPLIADRFDRKVILLTSAFFMCVCSTLVGFMFFVGIRMNSTFNWFPILVLVLFIIMFGVGFGSVPWIVLSEMFAPNIKSIAFSIITSQFWIAGFFVPFLYSSLLELQLDLYYAFWLFSLLSGAAFFFNLFVVIETRGLSLQEIQNKLKRNMGH